MEKPRSLGSGALCGLLELRLGCGSFYGGAGNLGFGAEPVFHVVAILPAALLIQFICPTANLFMQIRVRVEYRRY